MSDTPKPRFQLTPELEGQMTGATEESMEATMEAMRAITKIKVAWMDKVMKRFLPPDIYARAMKKGALDHRVAAEYILTHGIRVEDHPDHSEIRMGEAIIGIFRIVVKDNKCKCQSWVANPEPKRTDNSTN